MKNLNKAFNVGTHTMLGWRNHNMRNPLSVIRYGILSTISLRLDDLFEGRVFDINTLTERIQEL